ncbi:MAG: WG repeat-containing protein, partial [Bacteroidetes bacterium]|nr:WG repeat-containing protein [Bacteroidota bacterium]
MKIKHIIIAINLLFGAMAVQAQDLKSFEENGKYGFKNESGNVIIKPIYDNVYEFFNGLAVVYKKGKAGFGKVGIIDKTGKERYMTKEPCYLYKYNANIVIVKYDNGKYNVLSMVDAGKVLGEYDNINIFYHYGELFDIGLAVVKFDNDKKGIMDTNGKIILECDNVNHYDGVVLIPKLNGKYALIHKEVKQVTPWYDEVRSNENGTFNVKRDGKWGFVTDKGIEIVPPVKDEQVDFSNGFVLVGYSYIDKTGNVVLDLPIQYEAGGDFSKGMAKVGRNGKIGLIDQTGKEIIPPDYDDVWALNNVIVLQLNEKFGFANRLGKITTSPKYDIVDYQSMKGGILVKLDGKLGFTDSVGNEIVPPKYDAMDNAFTHGIMRVMLNEKLGFINEAGKEIVPPKYDGMDNAFTYGTMAVTLNGKFGFINEAGKEIVPPKYDIIDSAFINGIRRTVLNQKIGFIDSTGKEVILPKYDELYFLKEGLAIVKLNEKFGFIDKTGAEIVPPKYDNVENSFKNGIMAVKLNGKLGIIDKTGKEIAPPKYDAIDPNLDNGKRLMRLNGKLGMLDAYGKEITPPKYDAIYKPLSNGIRIV